MNKLDGWTCTIFRNTGPRLSSALILEAEEALGILRFDCGPDGFLTYVFDKKIRSTNPGFCFKQAGWKRRGRSANNTKTLLTKPFALKGVA